MRFFGSEAGIWAVYTGRKRQKTIVLFEYPWSEFYPIFFLIQLSVYEKTTILLIDPKRRDDALLFGNLLFTRARNLV